MIVAGIGLRKDATVESLRSAMALAGADSATAIATPDDKADHPALVALAAELKLPIVRVSHDDLVAQDTQTQSKLVAQKRGTGSVAEAAALAAAGQGATLKAARVVSDDRMATCAIAEKA